MPDVTLRADLERVARDPLIQQTGADGALHRQVGGFRVAHITAGFAARQALDVAVIHDVQEPRRNPISGLLVDGGEGQCGIGV